MAPSPLFHLALPHGACAGVRISRVTDHAGGDVPPDDAASRPVEEARALAAMAPARRASWIAGRAALRAALADIGITTRDAILASPSGAPLLPPGAVGSISHKDDLAVAIAARAGDGSRIGIDLERDVLSGAPARIDIAGRVLTPSEAAALASLPPEARRRETLLRFSAKEAIYKALHPFVDRALSFQEAAIAAFAPDGGAQATLALARGEGPFDLDVRWTTVEGFVLTTARIAPRHGSP